MSGSEVYSIQIDIAALSQPEWRSLKAQSAGKIGTLVELLQGKLSKSVMELVADRKDGLFPKPKEIKMRCSCPDGAYMCKHLAAVLYGVGNRLDSSPELLFVLRGVDHLELIEQAIPTAPLGTAGTAPTIATADLGAIFDIEMDEAPAPVEKPPKPPKVATKARAGKPVLARKAAVATSKKTPAKPAATKARVEKPGSASKAAAKIPEKLAAKPATKKTSTTKKVSGPGIRPPRSPRTRRRKPADVPKGRPGKGPTAARKAGTKKR